MAQWLSSHDKCLKNKKDIRHIRRKSIKFKEQVKVCVFVAQQQQQNNNNFIYPWLRNYQAK